MRELLGSMGAWGRGRKPVNSNSPFLSFRERLNPGVQVTKCRSINLHFRHSGSSQLRCYRNCPESDIPGVRALWQRLCIFHRMGRPLRVIQNIFPYHLVCRTNNHAICVILMSNHYHIIATATEENLHRAMSRLRRDQVRLSKPPKSGNRRRSGRIQ